MKKLLTVLALSLTTSVCFAALSDRYAISAIPADSRFIVNQEITIPADVKYIHFNKGSIVSEAEAPKGVVCDLAMNAEVKKHRVIKPNRVLVTSGDNKKVNGNWHHIAFKQDEKSHIAGIECINQDAPGNVTTMGEMKEALGSYFIFEESAPEEIERSTNNIEIIEN
jgi:uncharacterized protein YuzE